MEPEEFISWSLIDLVHLLRLLWCAISIGFSGAKWDLHEEPSAVTWWLHQPPSIDSFPRSIRLRCQVPLKRQHRVAQGLSSQCLARQKDRIADFLCLYMRIYHFLLYSIQAVVWLALQSGDSAVKILWKTGTVHQNCDGQTLGYSKAGHSPCWTELVTPSGCLDGDLGTVGRSLLLWWPEREPAGSSRR